MARETWLGKLKSQLSLKLIPRSKPSNIGVLSFEIATLLSKLLALHHSLSDSSILRLKNDLISFHGIRKIISDDDSFLLNLACAEFLHTLHFISNSTARLSFRCSDSALRSFPESVEDFVNTGRDQHGWAAGPATTGKDLDGLTRRADRYIAATSALYLEMEELNLLENSLRKKSPVREDKVLEIQQKIVWQRQQVKHAKDKSLWNRSYDSVILLLARLIFTILARIKLVFGIGHSYHPLPPTLPRSLSASATVFPSSDLGNPNQFLMSGPLISTPTPTHQNNHPHNHNQSKKTASPGLNGFFHSRTNALKPPPTTLGAAALALHYANLIIVLEKMIKAPHLVGLEAREDVYAMLPISIRSSLRARLKGVGFSATDPVLAGEWRDALARILAWLAPLAHNMIKWQSERSFEQHNLMPKSTNVLLLQTLYFANQDKTEAAITELLVGLNYIWRFDREMNAKALLECSNFFNNNNNFQTLAL